MSRRKSRTPRRKRVGRVSYYRHHGAWYLYYREGKRQVRRRVGTDEPAAAQLAAQLNADLSRGLSSPWSFEPLSIPELRRRFLDHHENVVGSSLATVNRYRTAISYLERFAAQFRDSAAHEIRADAMLRWMRTLRVAPNGHPNTSKRPLREKGIRFVLETCRALYHFAAKRRHLPPYFENPFGDLSAVRTRDDEAASVFVFDAETEAKFFRAADAWSFPIHFLLAKTGIRPGELAHLLIDDLDLEAGWLRIRSKPELEWRVKTRTARRVPLIPEAVAVLRHTLGNRTAGVVFLRPRFVDALDECDLESLSSRFQRQLADAEQRVRRSLSRAEKSRLARRAWREAGAIRTDDIRKSFIRIAQSIGLWNVTCAKSWRHTFATLLQDANVDPLVRQITLGHAPSIDGKGALGMTTVYTHTRAETQKLAIENAIQRWPEALRIAQNRVSGARGTVTSKKGEGT